MNCKRTSLLAAIPAAFLMAGFAYGQTTPAQNSTTQNPPMSQPMSQQPMSQQPMSQQPMSQQPMSQQPMDGRTTSFSTLAGSKGYVTQGESARVPWLSTHFSQCDSNGDGHITRSEFDSCKMQYGNGKNAQGSGQWPQSSSSS